MTGLAANTVPADLSWRDRVALAAVQDSEQDADEKEARSLADRYGFLVEVGFCLLWVPLGAAGGWFATAMLLRPDEGLVNPVWTLLMIVGGPWAYLTAKYFFLLFFRWLVRPVSDVVIQKLLWFAQEGDLKRLGQRNSANRGRSLPELTAKGISRLLENGSVRPLAAAGSGTYWTAYAVMAVLAIWFGTAPDALGFGWESSWIQPSYFRAVIENVPLIGSDELTPIAAAPVAPYEDPAAMEARQAWVRFLSAGVAIYLLLPMCICTLVQFMLWRRRAALWRPRLRQPLAGAESCTHIVRLEQSAGTELPEPLQRLDDLGNLATDDDLERVRGAVHAHEARFAVVSCLSANEGGDDAIRQWLQKLADASNETPLLVLIVDKKQRQAEPHGGALPGCLAAVCSLASYALWHMPGCQRLVRGCSLPSNRAVADSLDAWDKLAQETNVALLECNPAASTPEGEEDRLLVGALGQQGATEDNCETAQSEPVAESESEPGNVARLFWWPLRWSKGGRRPEEAMGQQGATEGDSETAHNEPVTEPESEPGNVARLFRWPLRWSKDRRRPEEAMGQQGATEGDSETAHNEPVTEPESEPGNVARLFRWPLRWSKSRRRPEEAMGQQGATEGDSETARCEPAIESGAEPRGIPMFRRCAAAAKYVLPARWPWRKSRSRASRR